MAKQIFSNNTFRSTLASPIAAIDVSAGVTTGQGARFSSPTGGDYELLCFTDGTSFEIVKLTGRATDTLTITRAQEGTTALAWAAGTDVYGGITAAFLNNLPQIAFNNSGDARGADAINLQTGRTATANVASGAKAVALGYDTKASGIDAVSIGDAGVASGNYSVNVGSGSTASAANATSIGQGNTASAADSIAVGHAVNMSGATDGVGIGHTVTSSAADTVGIGHTVTASAASAVSVGKSSTASGTYGVAIGDTTTASAQSAIAISKSATASAAQAIAMGESSSATAAQTIAMGYQANSNGARSMAFGNLAQAGNYLPTWSAGLNTAAFPERRFYKSATGTYVLFLDTDGTTGGSEPAWVVGNTVADGTATWLVLNSVIGTGVDAVSIGGNAVVANAISIGSGSGAYSQTVAIGGLARGIYGDNVAIGYNTFASGYGDVVMGTFSQCIGYAGSNRTIVGYSAYVYATGGYSSAFGAESLNNIDDTHNTTGASIVRKDNGESASAEHRFFVGQENIWFSKEIDLKTTLDDAATITIPTGATLYPDELGLIVTVSNTVTVQPNVSYGITGNTTALLASTATTKSAVKGRDIFTPLSKDGINSFTCSVKTGATATTLKGRFYVKGILLEDE